MGVPTTEMAGCREAHRRLLDNLSGLTDDQARAPSRLPGWTVGHVLTHLARNADSVVRRLDAAAMGQTIDQYPGGLAGRAAGIAAGAGRPARDLVADVRSSAEAVDLALAGTPETVWDRTVRGVGGHEGPASGLAMTRWQEVEVHHVDLGLGYSPERWPPGLVAGWLPELLAGLGSRSDPATLVAWVIGRGPAPELAPWR